MSLQNGRNTIVPLVTVTEGIDTAQQRHKTINAVHFEGYGIDNGSFFEGISSFLHEKYRMEEVETVYVHADGGQWIQAAKDWLPNVRFVMDGFHLEKRLKKLSRIEGMAASMGAIRKAIRENDLSRFISLCEKTRERPDQHGREVLEENEGFIRTHWKAVVLRMSGEVCGSCTEPLVSHVLSERLSRNPLAWSEHGVRQMAMLRVYVQNGGVVSAGDIRVSRKKDQLSHDKKTLRNGFAKYKAYADKQIDDFTILLNVIKWHLLRRIFVALQGGERRNTGCIPTYDNAAGRQKGKQEVLFYGVKEYRCKPDWRIFDKPSFFYGKLDGSSILLQALGRSRNLIASA